MSSLWPDGGDASLLEPDGAMTELPDRLQLVADEQDGAAVAADVAHLPEALALERRVADGEHFVDHQDLGFKMRRHRKRQPHVHAGAVALDRRVEEAFDLREGDDLVELADHFGAAHAEDRAVQENVLAAGQFRVEAGADFEQARDAAPQLDAAARRLGDAAQDLEQRALAGAVAADDAEHLAGLRP